MMFHQLVVIIVGQCARFYPREHIGVLITEAIKFCVSWLQIKHRNTVWCVIEVASAYTNSFNGKRSKIVQVYKCMYVCMYECMYVRMFYLA